MKRKTKNFPLPYFPPTFSLILFSAKLLGRASIFYMPSWF